MYAEDSIALLKASGIDFARHAREGISLPHFGELLMTSGLVLVPDVRWISFHSGYDFGYLLKLLTAQALPADDRAFFALLHTYFPYVYDIKRMASGVGALSGGLNRMAEELGVVRAGPVHQAGSDSLVTAAVFFKLLAKHLGGTLQDAAYRGVLYGLGGKGNHPTPAGAAAR